MSIRRVGTHGRRGTTFARAGFTGNFAILFPGAFQSVQTDLGLTYGGTMLAAGTTPPVITLTGALITVPVPITVTDVVPGILGTWTGQVSYDGGATQAQSFTSAATVPLTGAGAGLTLNIAAGVAAGDNVWKATCAALADQSGNGKNYSQATATKQLVITPGLNGFPGLLSDGVDDSFVSTCNLPAPGVTPYSMFAVFRQPAWIVNTFLFGSTVAGQNVFQAIGSPTILCRVGASGQANGGAAINNWVILEIVRAAAATDSSKLGTTTATGAVANTAITGLEVASQTGGTNNGTMELLALAYAPGTPNWLAVRAAVTAKYGAAVLL